MVAFGSPSGVDAVAPSLVAAACAAARGLRSFVRPSPRSFSGWVCCCIFSHFDEAEWFAHRLASALSVPFCRVRSWGAFFSVSVPCLVRSAPGLGIRLRVGCRSVRFRGFRSAPVPSPSVALRPWFVGRPVVGFSGSRSGVATSVIEFAARLVSVGSAVVVGCARGVDESALTALRGFRASCPLAGSRSRGDFELSLSPASVSVLSVACGQWGFGRGAFAARSVACVRAVGAGGLWVSFPASPCPVGLVPSPLSSRCFSGSGSGTWASLAFAIGSGVASLVFLGSLPCPPGWGLVPVSSAPGWFGFSAPRQLSLF